jgi:hypothetical protein
MPEYNAEIIEEHADLFYKEADRATIVSVVVFGALGLAVGAVAFYFAGERNEALGIVLALGLPVGTAAIGMIVGESKAFKLRSQAQQLLALVTIERNTRKSAASTTIAVEAHAPAPSPTLA